MGSHVTASVGTATGRNYWSEEPRWFNRFRLFTRPTRYLTSSPGQVSLPYIYQLLRACFAWAHLFIRIGPLSPVWRNRSLVCHTCPENSEISHGRLILRGSILAVREQIANLRLYVANQQDLFTGLRTRCFG